MTGTAGSPEPGAAGPDAGLPVEAVIRTLEEYQQATLDLYRLHEGDPEGCVKALVRLHLVWTEEDPDRARMVARHRNAVMAGPGRERLMNANAAYFGRTREWLDRESGAGRMPRLSFSVLHALVFAPGQELARHWLGDRLRKPPTEYADRMGRAAWAGILAAGDPEPPGNPPASPTR